MILIPTEVILIEDAKCKYKYSAGLIRTKFCKNMNIHCKKVSSNSVVDCLVGTMIEEAALGHKNKHIYIVHSDNLGCCGCRTVRYFIRNEKKHECKFYILSKNPVSLLIGAYMGMTPEIIRRFDYGK